MKKLLLTTVSALLAAMPLTAEAKKKNDAIDPVTGERIKTGWNFGPLPAIGFNTDLGFQAGALCDIYYYGNGEQYPDYIHKFNVEASYYTKGSGVFHFFYDSKYLIPKVRFTAAATYMINRKYSFYGFNGAASPYFKSLDSNRDDGVAFYSMRRNYLRVLGDFQGRIKGNWGWAAGVAFKWYDLGDLNLKQYDSQNTLYRRYVDTGIIDADEKHGGMHLELKGGAVYDSRDHEAAPSRGIWSEACLIGSPDIFKGGKYHYLKFAAHFRHYVPVWGEKIVFAYHLAYQGTIAGNAPFYVQQDIATLYLRQVNSEGLGSINTVRGTLYNAMIGDGYAWSNIEMRFRIISFDFIAQHWYVATNPFFDLGAVVQPFRLDRMRQLESLGVADLDRLYAGHGEKLHMSAGLGIKLVMNNNFIISVEGAVPLLRSDGNFGMNVGLNYIF
ncbi:MAG: hypothetical protein J1E04_03345 [Alistipes sp.]|nr:hypothetical protein [Alistipes sp.]